VGLGVLTILQLLVFEGDATYNLELNSDCAAASEVTANGVEIHDAQFRLLDRGTSVLPAGTAFIAVNNTSVDAINGAFANLPEGAILTAGLDTFVASYRGGDGNDLELTVQP
jgi:hypothetical protein